MAVATLKTKSSKSSQLQDILKQIKKISLEEKLELEKELEKDTLLFRAKQLSKNIKPNKITLAEIVREVKVVRSKRK
ncbi:MAG: hypothetical protein ABI723_08825 [Bacteroidia bacterium]